jgi:SAM-dependent methyltransferase
MERSAQITDHKQASQHIWEVVAPGWEERHAWFERCGRPVTERMLERVDAQPGDTILELAAGTGIVGIQAALALPDAKVVISDFSEPMVEAAQRTGDKLGLTNAQYRTLDAEDLDLPDDSVDRVVCRWGYMLMPEPDRALAETNRVLRAGGRLSAAVFGAPERNPWAGLPGRVLVERDHMPPPGAGAPGILSLADTDRIGSLVTGAGFGEPAIDEVELAWDFKDDDDYWDFLVNAAGALSMVLQRLDSEEAQDVRRDVMQRAVPFRSGEALSLPGLSLVFSASAP